MNLPSVSISLFHSTFQINRSIYYVVYCIHFFPLNLTLLRFTHDTDFIKYSPSEPHSLNTETVLGTSNQSPTKHAILDLEGKSRDIW